MSAVLIKDLGWKYSGRKRFAIEHINLEIPENAFVSVVGPNEHGKTTLVSCIKGLIPNSFHGVWRGSVEIFGEDVRKMGTLHLASQIGFVFADPEAQFTSMTVEEELVFGLENIGLPLGEIQHRLDWVCDLTMIGNLLDKSPYEISGGQKQRVAIASVLAMRPKIIILDEPTSMLDPLGKENIFRILSNIKRETDLVVIVVEHNIEQVAPLSDLMVLMYEGGIAKAAPPAKFFENSDFLIEHGIVPPQATAFIDRIKQGDFYSGELPVALDGAVQITDQVLRSYQSGKDAR